MDHNIFGNYKKEETSFKKPIVNVPDLKWGQYAPIIKEAETWLNYKMKQGKLEYPGTWEVSPIGGFEFNRDNPKFDRAELVESIILKRRQEMQTLNLNPSEKINGKPFIMLLDFSLSDGAASAISGDFFDTNNVPLTDSWVGYFQDDIRSYMDERANYRRTKVHEIVKIPTGVIVGYATGDLIKRVQEGIDVNPEECILWLDDFNGIDSKVFDID